MTRIDGRRQPEEGRSMEEGACGATGGTSARSGCALVVADDRPLGEVLAEMLREMGFAATMCPPAAAAEAARVRQPAFVVLAIVASDALVAAVRHTLRADPWTAAIPVLAIVPPPAPSPRLHSSVAALSLALPFNLDDFVRCIEQVHPGHSRPGAPPALTAYAQLSALPDPR